MINQFQINHISITFYKDNIEQKLNNKITENTKNPFNNRILKMRIVKKGMKN